MASLFEEWTALEWEATPQAFYSFIRSSPTGRRWVTFLIMKLWDVAWDLWQHPNDILHREKSKSSPQEQHILNKQVSSMFHNLLSYVLSTDRYLLSLPLHQLLAKDNTLEKAQVTLAFNVIHLVFQSCNPRRTFKLKIG